MFWLRKKDTTGKMFDISHIGINDNCYLPLQQMVINNNYEMISYLIDKDANFDCLTDNGENLLFLAIKYASLNVIALLVKHVNIEGRDDRDNTPLMYAVYEGDDFCIKALIKHGADINAQNELGDTALISAIKMKRPKIAEILIKAGADVKIQNKERNTPLHIASLCADLKIIKMLIKYGADVNAVNKSNETAGFMCVREHTSDILEKCMKDINEDRYNKIIGNILEEKRKEYLSAIKILIKSGLDVTIKNKNNNTCLTLATKINNKNMMLILGV